MKLDQCCWFQLLILSPKWRRGRKKKKVKKFIIHCGFSFLRILLLVLCYISLQSYLMYQKRPYVWLSLFLIENCSVKVVF